MARAEECGGWQEATAGLLRKTKKEKKEEICRKEGGWTFLEQKKDQGDGGGLEQKASHFTLA